MDDIMGREFDLLLTNRTTIAEHNNRTTTAKQASVSIRFDDIGT